MRLLLLFIAVFSLNSFSQFDGSGRALQVDTIKNNSKVDITLDPVSSVKVNTFLGDKVLVSGALKELLEATTTTTEINYLSGVTSSVQDQLDSKQDEIPLAADGSLLYYNSGLSSLGIGTIGQILTVSALGFPEWSDPSISTTLDTKGQIQGFSTVNANIGPCTDGQILLYDSIELTGWKCSPVPEALPDQTGNDGKFLSTNGTLASWEDLPSAGAPDYNLITDSSFENELAAGTCTDCTISYASDIPFSSETNTKSLDLNMLDNITARYDEVYPVTNLDGKNGLLRVFIKTNKPSVLQLYIDGVLGTTEGVDQLTINPDLQWHKYELPFVFGDTDAGYRIAATDTTLGGAFVDLSYIGLVPDGYFKDISTASFVGSAIEAGSANCDHTTTINNTTAQSLGTDLDCTSYANTGNITGYNDQLKINIPNFKTGGTYRIVFNGLMYSSGASACNFALFNGATRISNVTNSNSTQFDSVLVGDIKFSSGDTGDIEVKASTGASVNCIVANSTTDDRRAKKFTVHFFPDQDETITTQLAGLTSKNKNEFDISVDPSTNTILKDDYNIMSSCAYVGSVLTCTYNTGIFTLEPSLSGCVLQNASGSTSSICEIQSSSNSTKVDLKLEENSSGIGAYSGTRIDFSISKTGADINKTVELVGTFKASQIKDGLVNSAATLAKKQFRIESCAIANNGSVSFDANYTDHCSGWVDSITRIASGQVRVFYNTTLFPTFPICHCALNNTALGGASTSQYVCNPTVINTTYVQFETGTQNLGGGSTRPDVDFQVTCTGGF